MPSRKSNTSIDEVTEHRSSLRRLSSLASLHNIFTRRRSGPVMDLSTNASKASTSNLSLQSTVVNPPMPTSTQHRFISSTSNLLEAQISPREELPTSPEPSHPARSSQRPNYAPLSDGSGNAIPRNRTFSNLPIPTRMRRATPLTSASAAASRGPSALPSIPQGHATRLPSPPASSRHHAHSRLASADRVPSLFLPTKAARIPRSDTEPLLRAPDMEGTLLPRSKAFKENISLSSAKPLPNVVAADSALGRAYPLARPGTQGLGILRETENLGHKHPSERPWEHRSDGGQQVGGAEKEAKSSPSGMFQRGSSSPMAAMKNDGMQKSASQPLLTQTPNNLRRSQHGEIKQTRLMSTRQAPTPPPLPDSGLSGLVEKATNTNLQRSRSKSNAKPPSNPPQTLQMPWRAVTQPPKTTVLDKSVLQVSAAESPAYWSGRLSSLADHYRNIELAAHLNAGAATNKTETDKMHATDATAIRLSKVFARLLELCVTSEAKESLLVFQKQFAEATKMPELCKPVVGSNGGAKGRWFSSGAAAKAVGVGRDGDEAQSMGQSMSEARKMKFMDRLLGKQKRRSLILVEENGGEGIA